MDNWDPGYLWHKRSEVYFALQRRYDRANETVPEEQRDDPALLGTRRADGTLPCGGCGRPILAHEPYFFMPGEGAHHLIGCINSNCVLCGESIFESNHLVRSPDPVEWGYEDGDDHVNHRVCVEAYELIKTLDLPEVCWPPDEDEDDE